MGAVPFSCPCVSNIVPILSTLVSLSRSFSKSYCFPSQARIVGLCLRFYQASFSRRSLNRYLSTLESQGYLRRIRRHKRISGEGIRFASTVYVVLKPAYVLLYRFSSSLFRAGVRGSQRLREQVGQSGRSLTAILPVLEGLESSVMGEVLKFLRAGS